ncbi:hypothetical protein M422DRAFT_32187, partial [Sphaerobolus stellatus SS14]
PPPLCHADPPSLQPCAAFTLTSRASPPPAIYAPAHLSISTPFVDLQASTSTSTPYARTHPSTPQPAVHIMCRPPLHVSSVHPPVHIMRMPPCHALRRNCPSTSTPCVCTPSLYLGAMRLLVL